MNLEGRKIWAVDGRGGGRVFDPAWGQQFHPLRCRGPVAEMQLRRRDLVEVHCLHEFKNVFFVLDAPRKVDRKPKPGLQQEKNGAPLDGVCLIGVQHRSCTHISPVMTSGAALSMLSSVFFLKVNLAEQDMTGI